MDAKTTKLEISPAELKARLDNGERPFILDIRESHEIAICSLKNSAHIPMGELPNRHSELADHKAGEIVVYCRSGARSDRCAAFLRAQGYECVLNLTGGILRWADEVDPTIEKY